MQPALTAAVRLVTIVPVPRIPSEARYGATVVSSRATLVLLATQLSAAVSSVRENNSVTNGPDGPATAGIAAAATAGSANIRAATAATGHRRAPCLMPGGPAAFINLPPCYQRMTVI